MVVSFEASMLNFCSKFSRSLRLNPPQWPPSSPTRRGPTASSLAQHLSNSTELQSTSYPPITPPVLLGLFFSSAAAARPQPFWPRHVISNSSRLIAATSQLCAFLSSTLPCNDAAPRSFSLCGGGGGYASGHGSARTPPHTT